MNDTEASSPVIRTTDADKPQGVVLEVPRSRLARRSCFGGPIAHIRYFRTEFVTKQGWLDERAYSDLVALCQFAPVPASSRIGFSFRLIRAGWPRGTASPCPQHC
jgi:chromate transporter